MWELGGYVKFKGEAGRFQKTPVKGSDGKGRKQIEEVQHENASVEEGRGTMALETS